ncbi:probable WRKY transcription factor 53 [Corylus avellana]|uniref:probable WRKY transcription factor 53 n=1 Tax=Corylus avellana TaxID=13451 RepID=UPI00286AB645|nr:probable WRKY transcription factor 53 [Corylus avellana]
MEKTVDWEQTALISELNQGKELAKQLLNHLHPSSSNETREFLVSKILSCYEKALSSLNWGEQPKPMTSILESPRSFANSSPRSAGSDQDSKHRDVYKKRKTLPRWTEQVKVCSGTGLEGPVDDGYSWRKYGQKDILGANFPRGYYRCTHRHGQGCLATKLVQRSDEDPNILEVTYRGRHTCSQSSRLNVASAPLKSPRLTENKNNHHHHHHHAQQQKLKEKPAQEIGCNVAARLTVKTEGLEAREEDDIFPSFSFSLTPIGSENEDAILFCESMLENNFMGSLSPTFLSPATSDSNMFPMSPFSEEVLAIEKL